MSVYFIEYLISGIYRLKIVDILGVQLSGILRIKVPDIFTHKKYRVIWGDKYPVLNTR